MSGAADNGIIVDDFLQNGQSYQLNNDNGRPKGNLRTHKILT